MQNRIAYTNPHPHTEYIGGVMIPPGETREIDPTHHPKYRAPDAQHAADAPQHIVDVLLAGDTATLLAHIPVLGSDDLQILSDREQAGARRENVLSALAERLLTLASDKLDGDTLDSGTGEQTDTPPPEQTGAKPAAKKAAGK